MVFKDEAVRERLKRLEEVTVRLSAYRGQPRALFVGNVERQWLVERGFILAAECVIDIASHILSGRFSIQPQDQEDAIRRLGQEGVISDQLTGRLRGLGGFRNLLVHEYVKIDPERVHEYLESELDSLTSFVSEISDWLSRA